MHLRLVAASLTLCLCSMAAFAQNDLPFQVRYASNLNLGDSVVNITNTGASSTVAFPIQNGNICANVYAFDPNEELISCCSCLITPNGVVSLSAVNDLVSNTLTPGHPTSIVIKLLSTLGTTASSCNASTVGSAANLLTTGMAAWGTTIHLVPPPFPPPTLPCISNCSPNVPAPAGCACSQVPNQAGCFQLFCSIVPQATETPFTPATLSAAELARITILCTFAQINGSGFGICKPCRSGALGAQPK